MAEELTAEQAALIDRSEIPVNNQEEEIYKENIIDHYKNPRNKKELAEYDFKHRELNPLCGDEITVYLQVRENEIVDVSFQGNGCAISLASISLLTDKIKGLTVPQVISLNDQDIFGLLGIPISYVRLKCALLSLKTIHKALGGAKKSEIFGTSLLNSEEVK